MNVVIRNILLTTAMLSLLKLTGDLAMSWIWVTALVWLPIAITILFFILVILASYMLNRKITKNLRRK